MTPPYRRGIQIPLAAWWDVHSVSQSYGVTVIGALSSTFSPRFLVALAASRAGSRPMKMVATAQRAQAMRAKKKVPFMYSRPTYAVHDSLRSSEPLTDPGLPFPVSRHDF